jgi:hypothetical protein
MTSQQNKGGRPPHAPSDKDRQMVEVLSGFAIPVAKIAVVLDITQATLFKHYRAEINRGKATVEAKLVGHLLRLANGKDGTALKAITFALQCRFGWSQYMPRLPDDDRERLGKKELAQIAAETGHENTEWGSLLQ